MTETSRYTQSPYCIINFENLEKVIKINLGKNYSLITFKFEDFTKKGDNYASFVTNIIATVKSDKNENNEDISYIAKINPIKGAEMVSGVINNFFIHEGEFLYNVCPPLNETLDKLIETPLNMPKCFFKSFIPNNEHLINEDMRAKGFKMINRKKGLDKKHTLLVLNELAKLHATCYIFEKKSCIPLEEKFQFLKNDSVYIKESFNAYCSLIDGEVQNIIDILYEIKMYEQCIPILNAMNKKSKEIYLEQCIRSCPSKFRTITHNDCWINNFLFK